MFFVRIFAFLLIAIGLFAGVRYIGATIHYTCHREPLINVEGGDDCAPPIRGVGEIAFYFTGGSFDPYLNRDTITVSKVVWKIQGQKIAADVTTYDSKTKEYDLGMASGCTGTTQSELQNHEIVIGRLTCDAGTTFVAFGPHGHFTIERYDTKAGSIATTTLVTIK